MGEIRDALNQIDRNRVALVLSVVPGVGHIYKRYHLWGWGILIVGNVLAVFVALWLSLATVGLSLLVVPILWIGGVAWSAFMLPDHHRHGTPTPPPEMTEDGHWKENGER